MRKETYMSTQKKKEKKKKNKKETKNVEKKIHTHQIKLKKPKGPNVQFCWEYICPKARRKAPCFLSIISRS